MIDILKDLCELCAPSGREEPVRNYIIKNLPSDTSYRVDAIGNLIVEKKGRKRPQNKVMLDAHTDEVGFIITGITPDGLLRFSTIGGIEATAIISRRVIIEGKISGVICSKPVHQMTEEEKKAKIDIDNLYIDIGAGNIEEANTLIHPGDTAVFEVSFCELGKDRILAKALDDRIGCAVLLDLLRNYDEYDYTVSFSVQEEVGLRGARVSAYSIAPDYAIVVEATTAADIEGVPSQNSVCALGKGATVSFMDSTTLYDKKLYDEVFSIAEENSIKCQPKAAISGGNDAGAIHTSRGGVKTVSMSAPCRYIHSGSCVSSKDDIAELGKLVKAVLKSFCEKKK